MKLSICICEDTDIYLALLEGMLESYLSSRFYDYKIDKYEVGGTLLADYQEGYIHPDLVFMDILLPDTNGIDNCRKLREMGYTGDIIFITGSQDHAVEAFDVDARGYIVKPFNLLQISETLDRILRYASIRTLVIKSKRSVSRVPLPEILYVESQRMLCRVHCAGGVIYTVYKKLSEIEQEINDRMFLRCHQSYLVNMNEIVSVQHGVFILKTGDTVPIRRNGMKEIRQKYNEYIGGAS